MRLEELEIDIQVNEIMPHPLAVTHTNTNRMKVQVRCLKLLGKQMGKCFTTLEWTDSSVQDRKAW